MQNKSMKGPYRAGHLANNVPYSKAKLSQIKQQYLKPNQQVPDSPATELYIASSDGSSSPETMKVPPPDDTRAVTYYSQEDFRQLPEQPIREVVAQVGLTNGSAAIDRVASLDVQKYKMELAEKSGQLQQAAAQLRVQMQELKNLKTLLAQQNDYLRRAKQDIIEGRVQVQEKEQQLREAYQALTESSKERAQMRKALIDRDGELIETQSQVALMARGFQVLNDVMRDMDTEEDELLAAQPAQPTISSHPLKLNGFAKDTSSKSVSPIMHQLNGAIQPDVASTSGKDDAAAKKGTPLSHSTKKVGGVEEPGAKKEGAKRDGAKEAGKKDGGKKGKDGGKEKGEVTEEQVMNQLQFLVELSSQVLKDAQEDVEVFKKATEASIQADKHT